MLKTKTSAKNLHNLLKDNKQIFYLHEKRENTSI